jgi:serine/threonine protein phosphatase PrpC
MFRQRLTLTTARFVDSYRRDASEDRAEILSLDDGSVVLVVADGVGGRPGGGLAATRAAEVIREFAPTANGADFWQRLLAHADTVLSDDPEVGETTCVISQVAANGRRIAGAVVGDSEAWLITRERRLILTEESRRKPYLGYGMAHPVPFSASVPASGATLLLASDGLFKYAQPDRIEAVAALPDLDEAAHRLVDLARNPAGVLPDDAAVLLCRMG